MLSALSSVRVRSVVALSSVLLGTLIACGGGDDPAPVSAEPDAQAPVPSADAAPEPVDAAPEPVDAAPEIPCLQDLKQRGLAYTETKARGVVDAITVSTPINGVTFASELSAKPSGEPMACEFVRTLWSFAEVLKAHNIHKIGTLGAYCYRCCCAYSTTNFCRGLNDPEPDCSANGYSNHSFGRALDVRYVYLDDGRMFDINKDADFKATTGGTCTGALGSQTGTSKFLYDLVCEVAQKKIFATILTPNYNSDHRNHWHMDTGQKGIPKGTTVRSSGSVGVDEGEHPDSCGE